MAAGDLAVITDHVNLAGISPLAGPNDERLGPRFTDMTDVYTPALRAKAHAAAARLGQTLREGVYFWFRGPMFETPAEIRMAKALGGSMVGMSTVPEATAARHMGAQVLGISLCTNLAAGMSDQPLSHTEVIETAAAASERFSALFDELLPDPARPHTTTNLVDISSGLVLHSCDSSARARSRSERPSTGQNSNFLPDWTLRSTPRSSRPSKSVRAD